MDGVSSIDFKSSITSQGEFISAPSELHAVFTNHLQREEAMIFGLKGGGKKVNQSDEINLVINESELSD